MKILHKVYVIISFLLLPLSTDAQIKDVSSWESSFVKKANKNYDLAKSLSTSQDSRKFYDLAYYIDANVAMYKATNKVQYVESALEFVFDMIDSAKLSKDITNSQYKDSFCGWIAANKNREIPLYESYIWRYVTDLLFVMKQNGLDAHSEWKSKYTRVYDFTIENIYNKWSLRGKKNLYRSNTHMMSHWVKISMNLYLITGDEKYKPIIQDFLNSLNENLVVNTIAPNKATLKWKSAWKAKTSSNYQDVSHGNAVIDVLIALYENELGVSKSEIDQVILMFDKVIWKSKNSFAKYVDGAGKGSGWFTDGFIKLGRFDENLQKRIEKHTKGRSVQFFANGALNAKLLSSNER